MHLTDTHCHIHEANMPLLGGDITQKLWAKHANPDPDAMIARARQNGVTRIVCVGCTLADSERAAAFAAERQGVWAAVGVHPHETKGGPAALSGIAQLLPQTKIVAIGEIGLDYFYEHSSKADQQKALRFQIELALRHNLPIIFHVREAFDDFWPIFDDYEGIRGVLHSYTDTMENFERAMERDLYIGINGIVTFTKIEEQLAVAKAVTLHKLLLETDAPFLTPRALRGNVNEPAYVRLVTEFLADLREESIEAIAAATTKNAQTLFTLD